MFSAEKGSDEEPGNVSVASDAEDPMLTICPSSTNEFGTNRTEGDCPVTERLCVVAPNCALRMPHSWCHDEDHRPTLPEDLAHWCGSGHLLWAPSLNASLCQLRASADL